MPPVPNFLTSTTLPHPTTTTIKHLAIIVTRIKTALFYFFDTFTTTTYTTTITTITTAATTTITPLLC